MDLPDSAWVSDEEDSKNGRRTTDRTVNGIAWYWWCAAVFLLLFLSLGALRLLRL
jgi:hypothetical protein